MTKVCACVQAHLQMHCLNATVTSNMDFSGGLAGKESACNVGGLGSIPGLRRSPGEGKRLPTPVFWPGKFHGLYSPWDRKELDTTERFSLHFTSATCSYLNLKLKNI